MFIPEFVKFPNSKLPNYKIPENNKLRNFQIPENSKIGLLILDEIRNWETYSSTEICHFEKDLMKGRG